MPKALSRIVGYSLHESGSLKEAPEKSLLSLKKWYEQIKKLMPKNSIIIQSTTSHVWPNPAYLFKQATWAFVDLFYFLPEIPMTFIG